jgi:hypothetical protein
VLIHDMLQEAIDGGEVLKIKYHGGSQPGTVRQISPISISKDKVRARCLNSNAVKTFVIDKIEVCDRNDHNNETQWDPAKKSEVKYGSFAAFCGLHRSELESLGWHVNSDANFISLHRRFKNGKPLKGSDVSLDYSDYEEYVSDLAVVIIKASDGVGVDLDGELREENIREHRRPWLVRARGMESRTYAKLDRAADSFMERARLLSPKNR